MYVVCKGYAAWKFAFHINSKYVRLFDSVIILLTIIIKVRNQVINMTRQRDPSALWHLPTSYNLRNYCIHVHVFLFVGVHVRLSIG